MIGAFGDIVFETSDRRILNFSNFALEASGRYATHELINQKPRIEFLGPGLLSLTFTVKLNSMLGVNPREEMNKWLEMVNTGEVRTLILGETPVGDGGWIVKSVSQLWEQIFQDGKLFSGKIDVTLEEYIEGVI